MATAQTNPFDQFDENPFDQFDELHEATGLSSPVAEQRAVETGVESMESQIEERQYIKSQLPDLVPVRYDADDSMLQFSLGKLDTVEEQIAELEKWDGLPEGAEVLGVQTLDGMNAVGFRKDDAFYVVNAMGQGGWEKFAGSVLSGETIGATAISFHPAVRGRKILGRALWEAIGAGAGKSVDEAYELATDKQRQDMDDLTADIAEAGIWGAGGATIGNFAEKFANLFAGKGFRLGVNLPEGSQSVMDEALVAAKEEGLSAFAKPGTVLYRSEQQAEAMGLTDAPMKYRAEVLEHLESLHDAVDAGEITPKQMLDVLENLKKEARLGVEKEIKKTVPKMGDIPKEAGGDAYAEGVDAYRKNSGGIGDKLYNKWLDMAEEQGAAYDVTPFLNVVDDVNRAPILQGERRVVSNILDSSGKPFPPTMESVDIPVKSIHEKELKNILSLADDLKEIQSGDPRQTTQALKKIRTQLRQLSEKDSMQISKTESQVHATRLLGAMHEVLDNPISGNSELTAAAQEAGRFWKKRAEVLDAITISDSTDGEALYKSLAGKLTAKTSRLIKRHLPKKDFEVFKAAVATDLLNNPNSSTLLKSPAYKDLIPLPARKAINLFHREMKGLDMGVLSKAIGKRNDMTAKIGGIIETGTAKELDELVSQGMITRPQLQDSIFTNLIDKSSSFVDGMSVINPKEFTSNVKKLKSGKFWKSLTSSQRKALENTQVIASIIKASNDAGNSLIAAELTSRQAKVLEPVRALQARVKAIQTQLVAQMGRNPKVVNALYGAQPYNLSKFRATVLGTIQSMHQLQDEELGNLNGK